MRLRFKPLSIPGQQVPPKGVEEDIRRLVEVAARDGHDLPGADAAKIWLTYSESQMSGWLTLPVEDERLLGIILRYTERADGSRRGTT